jgi:hypothetical protein
MKPPFQVATFEGYRSSIIAELAPSVAEDVRGIEVRLNPRQRHIEVVVFRIGDAELASTSRSELQEKASLLASRFDDFAGYSTGMVIEACDADGPLVYRGVPVWERSGTRWTLASAREPGILVQV